MVCVCSIYLGFGWLSNHVTKCYKGMCHVCIWCVCSIYLGSGWPSARVAICYVSCVCVWCVCSIFLGSGWPSTRVAKCYKGDVMVCELDFEQVRVKFYRNDQLVGVL